MHPGEGTLRHPGGDAVGELMAEDLPNFELIRKDCLAHGF